MPRYESRPVVVEAWILGYEDLPDDVARNINYHNDDEVEIITLWVEKSKKACHIEKGDAIIRERDGVGFYPCVAAEFVQRYNRVVELVRRKPDDMQYGGGDCQPTS